MKLYTEEQLTKYLLDEGIMELSDLANNLIPHIELPSDEEIEEVGHNHQRGGYEWQNEKRKSFIEGIKYLIDKIQGGNNEQ